METAQEKRQRQLAHVTSAWEAQSNKHHQYTTLYEQLHEHIQAVWIYEVKFENEYGDIVSKASLASASYDWIQNNTANEDEEWWKIYTHCDEAIARFGRVLSEGIKHARWVLTNFLNEEGDFSMVEQRIANTEDIIAHFMALEMLFDDETTAAVAHAQETVATLQSTYQSGQLAEQLADKDEDEFKLDFRSLEGEFEAARLAINAAGSSVRAAEKAFVAQQETALEEVRRSIIIEEGDEAVTTEVDTAIASLEDFRQLSTNDKAATAAAIISFVDKYNQ